MGLYRIDENNRVWVKVASVSGPTQGIDGKMYDAGSPGVAAWGFHSDHPDRATAQATVKALMQDAEDFVETYH